MFRGHYQSRADEKGRVKVPADFKRELDARDSGGKFYVTSRDGKFAQVWPLEEWQAYEQIIKDKLPVSNPLRQKLINAYSFYGQEVEMDNQGRLLLPSLLREQADLKGDLSIVGKLEYLEVHNYETFSKQVLENPITDEDSAALSELGI
jgi:MraZ protein